jgi:FtsP/CotA-like multicopper oxidase with cupredoxin domain
LKPFGFLILGLVAFLAPVARANHAADSVCSRPAPGAVVAEPEDLRSQNGTLKVALTYRNFIEADGEVGYCYLYKDGSEAPTLRLKPGDWLILTLKNDLTDLPPAPAPGAVAPGGPSPAAPPAATKMSMTMDMSHAPCGGGASMSAMSTNLHFHGITVPAVCHQDDVLRTAIDPAAPPFEYKFQIPADEPPGLYWYHPHIHGFTKVQVLGGASGALIVEGIERAEPVLAGLPERVLIVRDQDLVNPAAPVPGAGLIAPTAMLDKDGDAQNTGSGIGKPAKDLSLNYVPVSFPAYEPAVIRMKPQESQLWRVLNASAITYLNLQVVFNNLPQAVQVVAMDGVPLSANGMGGEGFIWLNHIGLPPGGRAEFVVKGPAEGVGAFLLTRSVNTGAAGENDPVRPLARIVASVSASEMASKLSANPEPLAKPTTTWLGSVTPVRTRKLYFYEKAQDPNDPNSPTKFMLVVEGQPEVPYDPNSTAPNIVAHQGDVEDWIIENRTQELHAFHIHQVHYMLVQWFGIGVDEPYLRDTINVPFWDGKSPFYPSVKIRVDFRDPNSVGTFLYHCHLLEHEDGGMMGTIRVDPSQPASKNGGH